MTEPLQDRLGRPLPARTSEVLESLVAGAPERITFGEILVGLRHRAFGFAMLVFALPCCLPMPPGIPTVCGIALAVIALQLLTLRLRLWLPRFVADRSVARADLERMVARAVPYLQRLERLCRPRLAAVTATAGKIACGGLLLVLALIMIAPIPLVANIPPALAVTVMGIGLTERDGAAVLAAWLLGLVAIAIAAGAVGGVVGLIAVFMR